MPQSSKKQQAEDRRARVEALRKEQEQKDRRRKMLVFGISGALALGIIAAAAIPLINQARNNPANKGWDTFGVASGDASCDAVIEEAQSGTQDHRPDGESITYETAPPASGPHYSAPAAFDRKFYTVEDTPEVERLVHNLEHGYTILWYDPSISDADLDSLEDLATKVTESDDVSDDVAGKFVVAPWDAERSEGAFPEGMQFALSHWGVENSFRQYCGELSGEAVRDFVQDHPFSDSPEPNAL